MKKNESKKITGELILYFATGETARPQVIGDNSLDSNRRVKNYDEVYDLVEGDKMSILNDYFYKNGPFIINEKIYNFLYNLALIWNTEKEPLKVEYIPNKKTKSWGEHLKDCEKRRKS